MQTGILVIISFIVVLFLFGIGAYFYKRSEKQKLESDQKLEKHISETQVKQMNSFFKEEVSKFFHNHKNDYENIDHNTKVSDLNDKYLKEINELINTSQVQSITQRKDSKFYKEATFLKEIAKESPFTWTKKFSKEIEEYYG